MPSLGKENDNSCDRITKSNLKPTSQRVHKDGSTQNGGPRPSIGLGSIQVENSSNSSPELTSVNGRSGRRKQPFRHPISAAARKEVFGRDHYKCRICAASPLTKRAVKLEVDHIVPVSRGGTNDPHNLQTLCQNCNRLKKASLI